MVWHPFHLLWEMRMSGRVLFLDIDGVLNSRECWGRLRGSRHKIDREKVAILNEVVAKTECRVTVSSTWRMDVRCRSILRDYGFRGRFSRDWRTDWQRRYHEPNLVRGDEIADWLSRNPVESYAIIDDDSDMLPEQMPRFVQTTVEMGLQPEHAERLVALLKERRA